MEEEKEEGEKMRETFSHGKANFVRQAKGKLKRNYIHAIVKTCHTWQER